MLGKATETQAGSTSIGATISGFNIGASGTYARASKESTGSGTKHFVQSITKQKNSVSSGGDLMSMTLNCNEMAQF